MIASVYFCCDNDFALACIQVYTYECPLHGKHNCECKAKIRVIWTSMQVRMEIADMHTAQSHCVDNRKYLSHQQRNAVVVALQSAPLLTPTEVRCNIKNFSPSKQIKADKLGSVRRVVRKVRVDMTAVQFPLCPVPVTDSYGSLTSLCESLFLPILLLRHNDVDDDFHLRSTSRITLKDSKPMQLNGKSRVRCFRVCQLLLASIGICLSDWTQERCWHVGVPHSVLLRTSTQWSKTWRLG